jgi:hypothetical protein
LFDFKSRHASPTGPNVFFFFFFFFSFFAEGNSYSCLADPEVGETLNDCGIKRVVVGHQPHGYSPAVIKDSYLEVIDADTSYRYLPSPSIFNFLPRNPIFFFFFNFLFYYFFVKAILRPRIIEARRCRQC